MSELTITKGQLRAALHRWEVSNRTGECLSPEEAIALPADEVAEVSADHLWGLLRSERANQSLIKKLSAFLGRSLA